MADVFTIDGRPIYRRRRRGTNIMGNINLGVVVGDDTYPVVMDANGDHIVQRPDGPAIGRIVHHPADSNPYVGELIDGPGTPYVAASGDTIEAVARTIIGRWLTPVNTPIVTVPNNPWGTSSGRPDGIERLARAGLRHAMDTRSAVLRWESPNDYRVDGEPFNVTGQSDEWRVFHGLTDDDLVGRVEFDRSIPSETGSFHPYAIRPGRGMVDDRLDGVRSLTDAIVAIALRWIADAPDVPWSGVVTRDGREWRATYDTDADMWLVTAPPDVDVGRVVWNGEAFDILTIDGITGKVRRNLIGAAARWADAVDACVRWWLEDQRIAAAPRPWAAGPTNADMVAIEMVPPTDGPSVTMWADNSVTTTDPVPGRTYYVRRTMVVTDLFRVVFTRTVDHNGADLKSIMRSRQLAETMIGAEHVDDGITEYQDDEDGITHTADVTTMFREAVVTGFETHRAGTRRRIERSGMGGHRVARSDGDR